MNRVRLVVALVVAAGVTAAVVWVGLPGLVDSLPGRVRQYLPEEVNQLAAAALPAALPTPERQTTEAPALPAASPASRPSPQPTAIEATPSARQSPVATPTSAAPAAEAIPAATATVASLPTNVRLDEVPVIPQKFNNCGPTNLTIVLNHYGVEVSQFDVAAVVRPNYEDRNVSPAELVSYVREQTDLEALTLPGGDLLLLQQLLAAGVPVIIEKGLDAGESTGWMGHYLTLFGYDQTEQQFLVRDTYLGPWEEDGRVPFDELERYWKQFNSVFVVVFRPHQAARLADIVPDDFDDPVALWSRIVEEARVATSTDAEDAFAWFNLGSGLNRLGNLTDESAYHYDAASAYDQARHLGLPPRMLWYQFDPYEAYLAVGRYGDVLDLAEATLTTQGGRNVEETYLYQGLALRDSGDSAGAREALVRAAQLNPDSPTGASALAALETLD